jgi:hypothetical protein
MSKPCGLPVCTEGGGGGGGGKRNEGWRQFQQMYIQNKKTKESAQSCTVRRKTFASQQGSYPEEVSLTDFTKITRLADPLL